MGILKWRKEVDANLRRENGWLALAGVVIYILTSASHLDQGGRDPEIPVSHKSHCK